MSLYLTFPVVMFWISNQAEWFEDYVVQRKRELWPREKEGQRQELEEFKQKIRKQKEESGVGLLRRSDASSSSSSLLLSRSLALSRRCSLVGALRPA